MSHLDTLDRNDLLTECIELAREQGVSDPDVWNNLTDEVIAAHLDLGELNQDQDLEGVRTHLQAGWAEYNRIAGEESLSAIGEDPEAPKA